MLQSGHGARDSANYDLVARDYNLTPTKPTLDGEIRYEDHPVNFDPKNGWFDEYDVRQAAWWGVLAGGGSQYFKRLRRGGRPHQRRDEFVGWLGAQGAGGLAKSLAALAVLNQSKAYLYWCRDRVGGGRELTLP
jgi:hypothetical protein